MARGKAAWGIEVGEYAVKALTAYSPTSIPHAALPRAMSTPLLLQVDRRPVPPRAEGMPMGSSTSLDQIVEYSVPRPI